MFDRQKSPDLRSCLQWKSERDGWVFQQIGPNEVSDSSPNKIGNKQNTSTETAETKKTPEQIKAENDIKKEAEVAKAHDQEKLLSIKIQSELEDKKENNNSNNNELQNAATEKLKKDALSKEPKIWTDKDLKLAKKIEGTDQDIVSINDLKLIPDGPLTAYMLLHMNTKNGREWLQKNPLAENKNNQKIVTTSYLKPYFQEYDLFFIDSANNLSVNEYFDDHEIAGNIFTEDKSKHGEILNALVKRLKTNIAELSGSWDREDQNKQEVQLEIMRQIASEYDGTGKSPDSKIIETLKNKTEWVDLVADEYQQTLKRVDGETIMAEQSPYYLYLAKLGCGIKDPGAYKFLYAEQDGKKYVYALKKNTDPNATPTVLRYDVTNGKFSQVPETVNDNFTNIVPARSLDLEKTSTETKTEYQLALAEVKKLSEQTPPLGIPNDVVLAFTDDIAIQSLGIEKGKFNAEGIQKELAECYSTALSEKTFLVELNSPKKEEYRKYIIDQSAKLNAANILSEIQVTKKAEFDALKDDDRIIIKAKGGENNEYILFIGDETLGRVKTALEAKKDELLQAATDAEINEKKNSIWGKLAIMIFGKDEFAEMVKDGTFASFFTFLGFLGVEGKEKLEGMVEGIMDKISPGADIKDAPKILKDTMNEGLKSEGSVMVDTLIPKNHRLLVPASADSKQYLSQIKFKDGLIPFLSTETILLKEKTIEVEGQKYYEVPEGATLHACKLPVGTRLQNMKPKEGDDKKS